VGAKPFIEPLERRRLLATTGLSAVYFNNSDFTGSTVARNDKSITFTWNGGSPAPGVGGTTFSVRWNALIKPDTSETYTFITKNNDGVRLWVNGKLLIDSWQSQPTATRSATIALQANRLYDLRVEHFADSGGSSTMQLQWDTPTRNPAIIPATRLFAYDVRAASIGDYGKNNTAEADVARMIRGWAPSFVTTVGDNNYPSGSASTIDRNIGQYFHSFIGNYHGSYGGGSASNAFFPTLGNHDWEASNAAPYKNYFSLPNNERYYDFVKGPVHFFALDSDTHEPDGTSATSKQAQWLKSKMLASSAPFKVVYLHDPPYSSGGAQQSRMRWPFREWGADVVLAGSDHFYERLSIGGVPYIVNGAGASTVSFNSIRSESKVRSNSDTGALLIQANDLAMTLQYQHDSGRVVDTITIAPTPGAVASATSTAPPRVASIPSARNVFDDLSATMPFVGPLPDWSTVPIRDEILI
jgi:hypothetical protein